MLSPGQAAETKLDPQHALRTKRDIILSYVAKLQSMLTEQRKETGPLFRACYGKHSEDTDKEWFIECERFLQKQHSHKNVIKLLAYLKNAIYLSMIDINHLVLLEIFKMQFPETTNQVSELLKIIAPLKGLEYKQIQADAKVILDMPEVIGGCHLLTDLHEKIIALFESFDEQVDQKEKNATAELKPQKNRQENIYILLNIITIGSIATQITRLLEKANGLTGDLYQKVKLIEDAIMILCELFNGVDIWICNKQLVLLEVLKGMFPEITNITDAILTEVAPKLKLDYKEIQAEAKVILASPVNHVGERASIHELRSSSRNQACRLAFVSGSKKTTSSVGSFFRNPLCDRYYLPLLIFGLSGLGDMPKEADEVAAKAKKPRMPA